MSRARPRFRRVNAPLPALTSNLFELSLVGYVESQLTINTLYYLDNKAAGSPTSNAETELAAQWETQTGSFYRACMSNDWGMYSVKSACLNVPARIPIIYATPYPLAGGSAAFHEPTEVAVIMRRLTAFRGQSGRGRISLPAVPSSFVTLSSINAPGVITYSALANKLILTITTANNVFTPALASRRGITPNIVYGAAPLTNWFTVAVLGTIRRRRIGRGR